MRSGVAMSLLDSTCGPVGMLAQHRVAVRSVRIEKPVVAWLADVRERNDCVAAQRARIVLRHVQTVVRPAELRAIARQPVDERHMRRRALGCGGPGPALLDPAAPGAPAPAHGAPI